MGDIREAATTSVQVKSNPLVCHDIWGVCSNSAGGGSMVVLRRGAVQERGERGRDRGLLSRVQVRVVCEEEEVGITRGRRGQSDSRDTPTSSGQPPPASPCAR